MPCFTPRQIRGQPNWRHRRAKEHPHSHDQTNVPCIVRRITWWGHDGHRYLLRLREVRQRLGALLPFDLLFSGVNRNYRLLFPEITLQHLAKEGGRRGDGDTKGGVVFTLGLGLEKGMSSAGASLRRLSFQMIGCRARKNTVVPTFRAARANHAHRLGKDDNSCWRQSFVFPLTRQGKSIRLVPFNSLRMFVMFRHAYGYHEVYGSLSLSQCVCFTSH